jgi:nitrite reductase/ring-hydroxylating ferredoxin subunit
VRVEESNRDGAAPAGAGTEVFACGELAPGRSRKFVLQCGGREIECFVVNFGGTLHAYVNQCRHVSMSLDWVENQFFTEDADFLLCPTHGALYDPESGVCVTGPPCGKALHRVPLVEENGRVIAFCPDPLPDA